MDSHPEGSNTMNPCLRSSVFLGHLAAITVGLAATAPVSAQMLISPWPHHQFEGSKSTSYPLGRANTRLQQLHADLGNMASTIQGHAYRRDAISTRGQVDAYQVEMTVALSMSPLTPGTASRTFASNAGTPQVVLPRTWVNFPVTNRPPSAPASTFELRIPYAVPFTYPVGGGTLCVDTTVHGNNGPNGPNANFTAYLDAHQLYADGRSIQPGYKYGAGCALLGSSAATATFELRTLPSDMEFDIVARNGVPGGMSALMVGLQSQAMPVPGVPGCVFLTSVEQAVFLPGMNDPNGGWSGTLTGFPPLPVGLEFFAQIASGLPGLGVGLSEASRLVMPPPGITPIPSVRIAHGTNNTSPTGTVSTTVPVVEFF